MLIRFLKQYGPWAAGETREASEAEADQLIVHGVAEAADKPKVRHATEKPAGKRNAAIQHDEG
jgi:hypothetical protein